MSAENEQEITDELRVEVMKHLFELLEHPADKSSISHRFTGVYGDFDVRFKLDNGLADWALVEARTISEKVFNAATEQLAAKGQIDKAVPYKPEFNTDLAALMAFFLVKGIAGKMISAFTELELETAQVYEGYLISHLKDVKMKRLESGEVVEFPALNVSDGIKEVSKMIAAERKQFLTAQINSLAGKPRLEKLAEHYPVLLKVWQSAKRIYDQNSESETWRDMVKAKYPEITFADELLTRVTGKLEDLPEDIQAKLAETDGDHTPSTIALEHAARMCGAKDYQFGTRYLHKFKPGKTKTEQSDAG